MTTVYRASDQAIQSITALNATPPSYLYPAADVLQFLNSSCGDPNKVDPAATSDSASSLLIWLISQALFELNNGDIAGYTLFRNLLALPLFLPSTKPSFQVEPEKTDNYIVKQVYRVVLSLFSIYVFCILSGISLVWCGWVMLYCWVTGPIVANLSQFAEVDFAAKGGIECLRVDGALTGKYSGLGNASTEDIQERLTGKLVFLGAVQGTLREEAVVLQQRRDSMETLVAGKEYT
jgi:hypothetical protein